jgi:hypothetical protein
MMRKSPASVMMTGIDQPITSLIYTPSAAGADAMATQCSARFVGTLSVMFGKAPQAVLCLFQE